MTHAAHRYALSPTQTQPFGDFMDVHFTHDLQHKVLHLRFGQTGVRNLMDDRWFDTQRLTKTPKCAWCCSVPRVMHSARALTSRAYSRVC